MYIYKMCLCARVPLRYPQLRDVSRLVSLQSCSVALIDTDKANLINLREKKYTRYTGNVLAIDPGIQSPEI